MQIASDEFEEFKEHLRRIMVLLFRWLATGCHLILAVIWHITVCAFPNSYRPHFHYLSMSASRPLLSTLSRLQRLQGLSLVRTQYGR